MSLPRLPAMNPQGDEGWTWAREDSGDPGTDRDRSWGGVYGVESLTFSSIATNFSFFFCVSASLFLLLFAFFCISC